MGTFPKYKKFLRYNFVFENLGNFFRYIFLNFTFSFEKCARPLHISLLSWWVWLSYVTLNFIDMYHAEFNYVEFNSHIIWWVWLTYIMMILTYLFTVFYSFQVIWWIYLGFFLAFCKKVLFKLKKKVVIVSVNIFVNSILIPRNQQRPHLAFLWFNFFTLVF